MGRIWYSCKYAFNGYCFRICLRNLYLVGEPEETTITYFDRRRGGLLALTGSFVIGHLGFLGARENLYLVWEREGYRVPVSNYGSPVLHSSVLLIVWLCYPVMKNDKRLTAFVYLEIFGIAIRRICRSGRFCLSFVKCISVVISDTSRAFANRSIFDFKGNEQ